MKLIRTFFIVHLLAATAALAAAYVMGGAVQIAVGIVLFGGLWFFANQRNAHGLAFPMLFGTYITSAALFYWFEVPPWFALIAAIAAVGAWDLDYFLQRLQFANPDATNPRLGIDHLRRLGLAEGLGLVLGIVGLTTQIQISFWVAVALALLTAIGLSRLIVYLRKETR
jgi:hypothetical protein